MIKIKSDRFHRGIEGDGPLATPKEKQSGIVTAAKTVFQRMGGFGYGVSSRKTDKSNRRGQTLPSMYLQQRVGSNDTSEIEPLGRKLSRGRRQTPLNTTAAITHHLPRSSGKGPISSGPRVCCRARGAVAGIPQCRSTAGTPAGKPEKTGIRDDSNKKNNKNRARKDNFRVKSTSSPAVCGELLSSGNVKNRQLGPAICFCFHLASPPLTVHPKG